MDKMWAGRFTKQLDCKADDFNSSIAVDGKMFKEDIEGSIAHAAMLSACNIIEQEDAEKITEGLESILADIGSGALSIDPSSEDIHMFVEGELTKRIGEAGKKLHTARSRNDQVATDTKLYIKKRIEELINAVDNFISVIAKIAKEHTETILPGYTHLQKAQPISFAHYLSAYANMFIRDAGRLEDALKRMDFCPLGSGALAGTTFPIDREMTARLLNFAGATANSLDSVSDRDYCIETASAVAVLMMHLSRFSEELILWSSWEFKYIELDDAFCTGSSMMPQKKNPDILELIRGKTGRAYGNLITLLTVMKSLPLAYNKDMQEDKEAVFDSLETATACVNLFAPMLMSAKILKDNMARSAEHGFINATDAADYLVGKGMPFRSAYKIIGGLVKYCIDNNKTLGQLTLEEYKAASSLFENDIYQTIALGACLERRNSKGGPSRRAVKEQIEAIESFLERRDG